MSTVNAYVARITAQCASFATVRKAWTTKPLDDFDAQLPAAMPYLAGVESSENGLDTGIRQEQTVRVGVLVVCEADDLEALRAELEQGLVGWEPEEGQDLVEHSDGNIIEIQGNVAWWTETYSHRRWLEF